MFTKENQESVELTNRAAVVTSQGRDWVFYQGAPNVTKMLMCIPDSYFIPSKETVGMPLTRENMLAVEILGRIEEANPLYIQRRGELLKPSDRARSLYPPTPDGCPKPYQHQLDAFASALDTFASGCNGWANWSSMGVGKTRTSIDLMRHIARSGISIVIAQKITLYQWKEEIERIWPDAEPVILQKQPDGKTRTVAAQIQYLHQFREKGGMVPERPTIFLINWETVARLIDQLMLLPRIRMVVADETQRMKNRSAQMTKATLRLSTRCEFKVAMSGTPMGNEPGDFFTQYLFLNPDIFGKSYWQFFRNFFLFGGWSGNEFVSINPLQLIPFIRRLYSCAFRVTKAVIADMPPKTYRQVIIPMTDQQARIYGRIEAALYAEEEIEDGKTGALSVASALAKVIRLQQITAGIFPMTEIMGDDLDEAEESQAGTIYRMIPSAKTLWTLDYVRELMSADEHVKILIWSRFRPELRGICTALAGGKDGLGPEDMAYIDGSTSDRRREVLRKSYNDRNNPMRVLVCQIQAASYGLDLPVADVLIYHSNTFSYLNRAQSEDRGHRIGRVRPYLIVDVMCQDSVDIKIMRAVNSKKDLSEMLLTAGLERPLSAA